MSYPRDLKCHQRNCKGTLTVPIKLIVKGTKLIDVARCPKCHRTYKFILSMTTMTMKNRWLPIIKNSLFVCYKCGTTHFEDYDLYRPLSKRLKLVFRCRRCRTKLTKVISRTLWIDMIDKKTIAKISSVIEKPAVTQKPLKGRSEPFPLTLIAGIGIEKLNKLEALEITNLADLTKEDPREIASMIGINAVRVQKWIETARALLESRGLPEKIEEEIPAEEKPPTPEPTADEMVSQLLSLVAESTPSPEPVAEEVPSPPQPIIKEFPLPPSEIVTEAPEAPIPKTTPASITDETIKGLMDLIDEVTPPPEPFAEEVPPPKPVIIGPPPPPPEPKIERVIEEAPLPPPEVKCLDCGRVIPTGQELCEECIWNREKERYEQLFICSKCGSHPIVVQKIKVDPYLRAKIHAKCPECRKSTHFILYLPEIQLIQDWTDTLAQSFFRCGECGTSCQIMKTHKCESFVEVSLYCEVDWKEVPKRIPTGLFQALMSQIQEGII